MKLILSAPPEQLAETLWHGCPIAHAAYQIGADFHLFRANIPLALRGGFMMLGDGGEAVTSGSPDVLANEVMKECIHRGFSGVVLAFSRTSPSLHAFAATLSGRLRRSGGELYLPESYAADSDWARVLIPTAISGGSLTGRLQEAVRVYGTERICLDIERVRRDFCLPASEGTGDKLSAADLTALIEARTPESYFSQDLCAYYFTYQDEHGSHFVLYDNAGSIRKKRFLAAKLGIDAALLLYPEVSDILPEALL